VATSDDAWLWHCYDLQDALCTWPGRRDVSFAVRDPSERGEFVAVVPAHVTTRRVAGLVPWSSVESFGGPAYRPGLADRHKHAVVKAVAACLTDLAKQQRAGEIEVAISALTPAVRGEHVPRVNPLLELGCLNTSTQTWLLDLRGGEAALWDGMEGRARTVIRKAERAGIAIRAATATDLDAYYALHQATAARTGIRPHPRAYFAAIWRDFLANDLAHVLLAEHEGSVVAAANFAVFKRGALYWTGAASERGLELGANALLQWRAMQWMLGAGVEWFETGEAFPNLADGKLKQLSDFKKSFGGTLYPYYRGQIIVRPRMAALLRFARDVVRGSSV
jgi:hypothetical protein